MLLHFELDISPGISDTFEFDTFPEIDYDILDSISYYTLISLLSGATGIYSLSLISFLELIITS